MFNIDYNILKKGLEKDLRKVDDSDLRYSLFLGNITFRDDYQTFLIDWDWIPILDFALSMAIVMNNLSNQSEDEFEFTESDEKIFFKKNETIIVISFSFDKTEFKVNCPEFRDGVKSFTHNVAGYIENNFPGIKENACFENTRLQLIS